ncbi:MAG: ribonuclease P protein component [Planctomycetota bacterium]|nr:ribonuclease P protein component [Planctomycetota bacterium]
MEGFSRRERLRSRNRIGDLFREGWRGAAATAAARALANPAGVNLVAVIAGKGLGGAVKRNRARRRLRAAYRQQKNRLPRGWDLAILAKPGFLEAEWPDVKRDVILAAERAIRGATGKNRPVRPR